MTPRHIRALVANDVRLHGRGILLTQVGIVAFVWVASRFPRAPGALVSLVCNLNLILALLWGDWLVSREKLKGTFGWVRTLPVSDRDLVAAKFLSMTACSSMLWVLTSLPFLGGYFADGRAAEWTVLLLSFIAFGALSIGIRWRFTQKLGMTVPLLIVLVPLLLLIAAKQQHPGTVQAVYGLWDHPAGKAAVAGGLICGLAGVFLWTERWVRRSDTFRLLE